MKLHRLRVWNFGAVRDIDVEFGPGLNVLYGPNDVGKSTLVDAIRLVLLLPHTSSHCEQFVPWTGAFNPTIELTFETETQRIWRIKKEFSRSGSSLLQASRNGRDFEDVARARSVDSQLRQILRWGIAEPGGSSGAKGLPASFLCTALLSTQANVSAMLRDSLEGDSASSGKERIEAALQAVAQDSMFIALLQHVQQRRDAAYTPTGNKKTSKDSVFKAAAERLNLAREEKERLHQIVVDSQGAEKTLRGLIGKHAARQEALDAAQQELAACERLAAEASAQAAAASEVRTAEDGLKRIQKIDIDVRAAERTLADLARHAAEAEQALEIARRASDAARQALASAEEAARVERSDPEMADTVVRQQLELRKLEADKSTAEAQQTLDTATEALRLVNAASAAEREYHAQSAAADRARSACADAGAKETAFIEAIGHCDTLERALELQTALKRLETAKADVERERALHQRLETLKGEHEGLVKQRAAFTLPAQAQVAAMRKLATDLATARGALEVGLMVTVSPASPLDLEVRRDGAASTATTATGPLDIEANAELEITVPRVATFLVRGGRRDAQENVRMLEDRWNREAVPHLEAAGAADMEDLDRKTDEARGLDNGIHSRDIEIRSLGPQLQALSGTSGALTEASQRVEACKAAIGNQSVEAASRDLKKLGADPITGLRKKRQQLSADLEAARKNARDAASSLTLAGERTRTSKSAFEDAVRARDSAMIGFPGGIPTVMESAKTSLASNQTEKRKIEAGIASLEKTIKARKDRVDAALSGAKTAAAQAAENVRRADGGLTTARTEHAAQAGRIEELRKLREAEDLEAAEAALKFARDRLSALPVPARTVTEAEAADARNKAEGMALALETLDRDIQRAHGALAQVGGAVARERLNDAVEAFELAERQEREVEEEYEAWKLLLDQMKEAEKAQASNLGQALAPAIAGRFQVLTQQRYENLQLTPQLRTEGVLVSGTLRSTDRISIGTREQLSTLYRLCLAEYLQTVVVLDDQLVQSDEVRMDWFRSLLKEKCRTFQIVVFTCRPRDYLDKTALVPSKAKDICLVTNDGFTRAVDLGKALLRQRENR